MKNNLRLIQVGNYSVEVKTLCELKKLKPFRALFQLFLVLVIYLSGVVIGELTNSLILWFAIWLVQAMILIGFTAAIHECIHGIFSKSNSINYGIGTLLSTLIFKNYSSHREFHLAHHKYTTLEEDPEPELKLDSLPHYLGALLSWPFAYFATAKTIIKALRGTFPSYIKSQHSRRRVRWEGLLQLIWITCIVAWSLSSPETAFKWYILPAFIMGPVGFFFMVPEHYGSDIGTDPSKNTRTIRSNAIVRFLYWNNNFHSEHHAFPYIPFYNLSRLHDALRDQIGCYEPSYWRYHTHLLRQIIQAKTSRPKILKSSSL